MKHSIVNNLRRFLHTHSISLLLVLFHIQLKNCREFWTQQ